MTTATSHHLVCQSHWMYNKNTLCFIVATSLILDIYGSRKGKFSTQLSFCNLQACNLRCTGLICEPYLSMASVYYYSQYIGAVSLSSCFNKLRVLTTLQLAVPPDMQDAGLQIVEAQLHTCRKLPFADSIDIKFALLNIRYKSEMSLHHTLRVQSTCSHCLGSVDE